jgi:ABC-type phosphate transport system permease subunit
MEAHHCTKRLSIDQVNGKLVGAVDWGLGGVMMLGDAMGMALGDAIMMSMGMALGDAMAMGMVMGDQPAMEGVSQMITFE